MKIICDCGMRFVGPCGLCKWCARQAEKNPAPKNDDSIDVARPRRDTLPYFTEKTK